MGRLGLLTRCPLRDIFILNVEHNIAESRPFIFSSTKANTKTHKRKGADIVFISVVGAA